MQLLEHIHLSVDSIEATERFLQAAMPQFVRRGGGNAPGYGEWVHLGSDSSYIALTEVKGAKAIRNLRHIGLIVEDIDKVIGGLKSAGFIPSDESALDEHPHRRRVYYVDPNGVDWEFVEYLSDNPVQRNDYSH